MTGRHRKPSRWPRPPRPAAPWPRFFGLLLVVVVTWHLATQTVSFTPPAPPSVKEVR